MSFTAATLAGQLLVTGFAGGSPSPRFARAASRGERAGAVLFGRNGRTPHEFQAMNAALAALAAPVGPILLAVDQEGGRVERIKAPFFSLPSMSRLARAAEADPGLVASVAAAQAEELRAVGFTMSFAPVLDVNTEATNPVIGDRAFGREPSAVVLHGLAFAAGLARGGVLACGKHFPGHGHTTQDSHLVLPVVSRDRAGLDAIDLVPVRAAARAGLDAFMSAHVLYPALDPSHPATLSRAGATDLLRGELGFEGVLVSDDLEMKALEANVEETSVAAIVAGCDLLLVCSDEDLADRAHAALVREIERSVAFQERATEAAHRGLALRRRVPPRPTTVDDLDRLAGAHDGVRDRLRRALERAPGSPGDGMGST